MYYYCIAGLTEAPSFSWNRRLQWFRFATVGRPAPTARLAARASSRRLPPAEPPK